MLATLLRGLFTILAVLWIIQALRPYFKTPPPPPPPPPGKKRDGDDDGEYIDYEEIK